MGFFGKPPARSVLIASGDVSEDTTALQNAIDDCITSGYDLLAIGDFVINDTITIAGPVRIDFGGIGAETTNTNGVVDRRGTVTWSGASALPMIHVKSDETDAYLFGVEIHGVMIVGNAVATHGLVVSSCSHCRFDVAIRDVTTAGMVLDAANSAGDGSTNILCKFNEVRLAYTFGAGAAVENSHGLVLDNSYGGVTQNIIWSVTGLFRLGDLVRVGAEGSTRTADNNHFIRVIGSRAGTSPTGKHMRFLKGGNHNNIHSLAGIATIETDAIGNRFFGSISEGGAVENDNDEVVHYSMTDYVTGARYETPCFTMFDEMQTRLEGTEGTLGLWKVITFPDGSTTTASFSVAPPMRWGSGNITAVKVGLAMDSDNTDKAVRLRLRLTTGASGADVAAAEADESFTVTVDSSGDDMIEATLTLTTPLAYTRGDRVFGLIDRVGADAADTAVDDMLVDKSIKIRFEGSGPANGLGPFDQAPMT